MGVFPVRTGFWFWWVAAAVVVLDQFTKYLVQAALPLYGPSVPVFPGVFLTHVQNSGVAFGQFHNAGPVLVVAAAVAAASIVGYRAHLLRRGARLHPLLILGLALPLGGAVGNLIDRVRLGQVVDFVDLRWWPIFNLADSAITLGALSLVMFFLLVNRPEEAPAGLGQVCERGQEHGA
jgi:signal peptidase II